MRSTNLGLGPERWSRSKWCFPGPGPDMRSSRQGPPVVLDIGSIAEPQLLEHHTPSREPRRTRIHQRALARVALVIARCLGSRAECDLRHNHRHARGHNRQDTHETSAPPRGRRYWQRSGRSHLAPLPPILAHHWSCSCVSCSSAAFGSCVIPAGGATSTAKRSDTQ